MDSPASDYAIDMIVPDGKTLAERRANTAGQPVYAAFRAINLRRKRAARGNRLADADVLSMGTVPASLEGA